MKIALDEDHIKLPKKQRAKLYFFLIRIIDLIVAFFGIIIFSPLLVVIALLIFLEDRHSPIYIDRRLGKDRKIFKFYKFRSMYVNAEKMEKADKEIYTKLRTGEHKIENHPFVTKIGKFIRKSSIDEMPQFLNVLKGDMCIVGPRALKIDEEEKFRKENPEYKKYLDAFFEVKPGITGYWQVSGRNNLDFHKRIRMEACYARNYSVLNYIVIMFKTPIAVFKHETS